MSGAPEFRNATVEAGIPEPRVDGVLRYLAAAGWTRKLGRGRRPKNSDNDWEARDFAAGILGFGAISPIDAPNVVGLLGEQKHTASTLHTVVRNDQGQGIAIHQVPDRVIDVSLHAALAAQIEELAEMAAAERAILRKAAKGLSIRLDVGRLEASIPFQYEDGSWGLDQFGPPKRNRLMPDLPKLSWGFEVKLEVEIIFIAADLLAETLAKQSGSTEPSKAEPPASGNANNGVTTTNENAPDPARPEASRCDRGCNQSRLLDASGQSHASEDREGGIFAQQRIPASDWVSPTLRRKIPDPCLPSMA